MNKQTFIVTVLYTLDGYDPLMLTFPITAYNLKYATSKARLRFPQAHSLTVEST
jgi:hypothetical protein